MRLFEQARQEFGYALRGLGRSPGFTATVALTFALGVGANAAVFSIIEPLMLRTPPGLASPGRLHRIYHVGAGDAASNFSGAAYSAIRDAVAGQAMVAPRLTTDSATLTSGNLTIPVRREFSTSGYLPLLTGPATAGRYFTAEEGDAPAPLPRAVLSHAFWQAAFGGDRGVVGREIVIEPVSYTVVGVAARDFAGLDVTPVDVWTTAVHFARLPEPWYLWNNVKFGSLVARTADGVDARSVAARATMAWKRTIVAAAPADSMRSVLLASVVEGRGPIASGELKITGRLAGVALIVLLVACANIATLSLLRAARRRREIAVRIALGVSRGRLVRQFLSETLMLSAVGGVVAVAFAGWGGMALRNVLMPDVRFPTGVLGIRLVIATVALTLLAGLLSGLGPAWQSSRTDLAKSLKEGRPSGHATGSRTRTLLLVGQSALSVVLIVGAGLFVRSLVNLSRIDLGLDPERTIIVAVRPEGRDGPDPSAVFPALAERISAVQGTEHVSLVTASPFQFWNAREAFVRGSDTSVSLAGELPGVSGVDSSFFDALGLRIVAGRKFQSSDRRGSPPVAVVSETMARTVWPGQSALGQCLIPFERTGTCFTVVGVSRDMHQWSLVEPPRLRYFMPVDQMPEPHPPATNMIVRASLDRVDAVAAFIATAVREEMPTARVMWPIVPMSRRLEPQFRPWRIGAGLFIALGSLALVVATIGVYSVLAYSLSRRAHEMGVRLALGARAADVRRLVLWEGLRVVAVGGAIGIGLALALGRLVSSLLYDLSSRDPLTMVASLVILLAAGLLAGAVPAWRAARVDPVVALRSD